MNERCSGAAIHAPGIWKTERGIRICTIVSGDSCSLVLYQAGQQQGRRIPFPKENRIGDYWVLELDLDGTEEYEYMLEADGKELADPFGHSFTGRECWGDAENLKKPFRSRLRYSEYDWEGDVPLETPMQDTVIYRMHPRGFTKHSSSGCRNRGTFRAIQEKIPYLKELGITAVELMPAYEFQELFTAWKPDGTGTLSEEATGKLNYWGYGPGYYFAPKASYSADQANPEKELKDLIQALHRAGIELYLELFFAAETPAFWVREAARFWVQEYHVDGIHLVGRTDAFLAEDPMLSRTKLFADYWENVPETAGMRHLAEYNQGFLVDMRRALRGEEDLVRPMMERIGRNPAGYGVVNYLAHTNGYTLLDLVTYEEKYNEANGEENRDGSNYNLSWNCGVEGPTRSKRVKRLRRKQLRNAYLLLLLSQGIPMLQAGDEFGNTQKGNNNAYCQDNEISWLNWKQLLQNRELHDFVRKLLVFRKSHPVFHKGEMAKSRDYLASGIPDVSYHGAKAWYPECESFHRQLGILYNGSYEKKPDGQEDDYFYVAYNMHRRDSVFGLPKLPKNLKWHIQIDSNAEEWNGIYEPGKEPEVENQREFTAAPCSIAVLVGKAAAEEE